jgi:methylated-DNA-protein-cysteine methyltransferase-like protein
VEDAYTEEVLRLVEAVPPGCVTTYGDLAEMVGRGGPRQVGAVLAHHGGGVPWWRVIRADGRPADGLADRALRLLVDEGVPVHGGRVWLASVRWQGVQADVPDAAPAVPGWEERESRAAPSDVGQ